MVQGLRSRLESLELGLDTGLDLRFKCCCTRGIRFLAGFEVGNKWICELFRWISPREEDAYDNGDGDIGEIRG